MTASLPLTLAPHMLSQAHQAPATLVIFLLEHPKLVSTSRTMRWPSSLPSVLSHSHRPASCCSGLIMCLSKHDSYLSTFRLPSLPASNVCESRDCIPWLPCCTQGCLVNTRTNGDCMLSKPTSCAQRKGSHETGHLAAAHLSLVSLHK